MDFRECTLLIPGLDCDCDDGTKYGKTESRIPSDNTSFSFLFIGSLLSAVCKKESDLLLAISVVDANKNDYTKVIFNLIDC